MVAKIAPFIEGGLGIVVAFIALFSGIRSTSSPKRLIVRTAFAGSLTLGMYVLSEAIEYNFLIRGDGASLFPTRYFGMGVWSTLYLVSATVALKIFKEPIDGTSRSSNMYASSIWFTNMAAAIPLWAASYDMDETVRIVFHVFSFVLYGFTYYMFWARPMSALWMNGGKSWNMYAIVMRLFPTVYAVYILLFWGLGQPGYKVFDAEGTQWSWFSGDIAYFVPYTFMLIHWRAPVEKEKTDIESSVDQSKKEETKSLVTNAVIKSSNPSSVNDLPRAQDLNFGNIMKRK